MSDTYTDLTETVFPDGIDTLTRMRDASSGDITKIAQYNQYISDGEFSSAAAMVQDDPLFAQVIFNAAKLNQLSDSIVAIERTCFQNGWTGSDSSTLVLRDGYSSTTSYEAGNCVFYNGTLWKCLRSVSRVAPGSNSTYWEQIYPTSSSQFPLNQVTPDADTLSLFGLGSSGTAGDIARFLGSYGLYTWQAVSSQTVYQKRESTKAASLTFWSDWYEVSVDRDTIPVVITYYDTLTVNQSTGQFITGTQHMISSNDATHFTDVLGAYVFYNGAWMHISDSATLTKVYDLDSNDDTRRAGITISAAYQVYSDQQSAGNMFVVTSQNRNAYPDSGTQDGITYHYCGVPFDHLATSIRSVSGMYVGTGGQVSLTIGFRPVLFAIQALGSSSATIVLLGNTVSGITIGDTAITLTSYITAGTTYVWAALG